MKKVIVSALLGLFGFASNAFALAATDFDVTTATADMGFAAVAVITLAVLAMGYAWVKRIL